jgi:hypothetical protein
MKRLVVSFEDLVKGLLPVNGKKLPLVEASFQRAASWPAQVEEQARKDFIDGSFFPAITVAKVDNELLICDGNHRVRIIKDLVKRLDLKGTIGVDLVVLDNKEQALLLFNRLNKGIKVTRAQKFLAQVAVLDSKMHRNYLRTIKQLQFIFPSEKKATNIFYRLYKIFGHEVVHQRIEALRELLPSLGKEYQTAKGIAWALSVKPELVNNKKLFNKWRSKSTTNEIEGWLKSVPEQYKM